MIFTLALAPIRVAPAQTIFFRSSNVRTPPEAFTPMSVPTTARISATSSAVAPPVLKPVEVLTKSAPALFARQRRANFFLHGQQRSFQNHLADRAAAMRCLDDAADIGFHHVILPRFQRADVQHHVHFLRAQLDGFFRFVNFYLGSVAPSGNPITVHTLTFEPRSNSAASGTFQGLMHTEANPKRAASWQSLRISSREASGFRSV